MAVRFFNDFTLKMSTVVGLQASIKKQMHVSMSMVYLT